MQVVELPALCLRMYQLWRTRYALDLAWSWMADFWDLMQRGFLPSSTSSYASPSVLVTTQGSVHSEGYDVITACNSTGSAAEDAVPGCVGFRSPFFPAPGFPTAPVLDRLLC